MDITESMEKRLLKKDDKNDKRKIQKFILWNIYITVQIAN